MSETSPFSRQLILDFPSRPEFNFSNFVVSEGSRFAYEAARQMASDAPLPYSTFYLYGDRNLGKTHLLMAIGNHISETQPEKKVSFINGQEFVRKIGEENSEEITQTLRRLLETDYFLLDDADLLAGKPIAQEKLYHIYNTLKENNKRAIFAGRHNPEQLAATEPYLKSRFLWGMTAEIKPIDDRTTAKIITKLGNDIGLNIPEKTINYLLTHIPRDFSSLKNSVEKINQESFLRKRKVSIPLAKEALNLS
jgi:chromosomal replication initiator protein